MVMVDPPVRPASPQLLAHHHLQYQDLVKRMLHPIPVQQDTSTSQLIPVDMEAKAGLDRNGDPPPALTRTTRDTNERWHGSHCIQWNHIADQ